MDNSSYILLLWNQTDGEAPSPPHYDIFFNLPFLWCCVKQIYSSACCWLWRERMALTHTILTMYASQEQFILMRHKDGLRLWNSYLAPVFMTYDDVRPSKVPKNADIAQFSGARRQTPYQKTTSISVFQNWITGSGARMFTCHTLVEEAIARSTCQTRL